MHFTCLISTLAIDDDVVDGFVTSLLCVFVFALVKKCELSDIVQTIEERKQTCKLVYTHQNHVCMC